MQIWSGVNFILEIKNWIENWIELRTSKQIWWSYKREWRPNCINTRNYPAIEKRNLQDTPNSNAIAKGARESWP